MRPTQHIDQLCINTMRTLAMDAVQAARSGHPGTPMAMAPVAYCVWQRFLRFDPEDPIWPNRDRFILAIGHASMLLYGLLHLTGVKAVNREYERLGELSVTLDDIRRFRQLDSKCPGHPEYRWTSGVEMTTGPLGQGVATSVGMAMAGQWMAAYFNRPGFVMFDYDVYALCGDGDMMEGVSGEAASLAGHLGLPNLCWIYDNNKVTIEGHTDWTFSDDVATRFIAYGWNVTRVGDANDLEMLERALRTFTNTHDRPTLIIVDSHIAYGAPTKQDTSAAHGEPLGEEEIRQTKRFYGWPEDAQFLVPDGVREHFRDGLGERGRTLRDAWMIKFEEYGQHYPALADHLHGMQHRRLPDEWDKDLPSFAPDPKGVAGRDASARVLNAVAQTVPWLIGGAADLAPSTKTRLTFDGASDFTAANYGGRNLHFGVREHAMSAILNGLSLGKVRPFGAGSREAMQAQQGAGQAWSEDNQTLSISDAGDLAVALNRWLADARPGDYVALQAYLAPTHETTAALRRIRALVCNRLKLATTAGYGPRFLHSTGQFHKGGPNTGLFLQLVDEPETDVPVPETDFTFGALIRAQALGDYRALGQRRRRVIRVNVGRDVRAGLDVVTEALA